MHRAFFWLKLPAYEKIDCSKPAQTTAASDASCKRARPTLLDEAQFYSRPPLRLARCSSISYDNVRLRLFAFIVVDIVRTAVLSRKIVPVIQGNSGGTVVVAEGSSGRGTDNPAGCCRGRPQQVIREPANVFSSHAASASPENMLAQIWNPPDTRCQTRSLRLPLYHTWYLVDDQNRSPLEDVFSELEPAVSLRRVDPTAGDGERW